MANPLKELPLKFQTFQTIQEIHIAAPPEKVWKAVTNPSSWFGFDADKANWPKSTLELQPGGRYMSFAAPTVHFGLGSAEKIDSVTVTWSDGAKTVLTDLPAGARYRIEREKVQ